jgi:ATP-binding cassette subfamily F protein uup
VVRAARKEVRRLERALELSAERESAVRVRMAASATDHGRLGDLQAELDDLLAERERLEATWLDAAVALE